MIQIKNIHEYHFLCHEKSGADFCVKCGFKCHKMITLLVSSIVYDILGGKIYVELLKSFYPCQKWQKYTFKCSAVKSLCLQ